MTIEQFTKYWFGTFAAVMFMGGKEETSNLLEEKDWTTQCLGTFYIKPNYPGKKLHVWAKPNIVKQLRHADEYDQAEVPMYATGVF